MRPVKAKTELLLYRLLWLAEKPTTPSYYHLEQSFEGWAYRNGLLNQIHQLQAQGWLESQQDPASGTAYRPDDCGNGGTIRSNIFPITIPVPAGTRIVISGVSRSRRAWNSLHSGR